jgi:ketosteroid isomerase-like protein
MTFLLLFFFTLTPAPQTQPADDIRAMLTAQAESWNRGDLAGFLAPYEHSEDITFFTGDTVTRGFAATEARYKRRYGNSQETMGRLGYENLEVTVLAPDAAVAYGRFRLQMKDSNPTGIFTLVLRKESGKWMIIHDHTSSAN